MIPSRQPLRPVKRVAIAVLLLFTASAHAQIAVRGSVVHTMEGDAIQNGVVLVRDGLIERVGPAASVAIPGDYRVLDAAVVTPGLVDARATVGVSGILNQPGDQNHLDTSAPIQPELRILDAYDPTEDLVAYVLGFGVTTAHVGPSPGAPVAGQTAVFRTHARTVADALMEEASMVAFTLGSGIRRNFESPGTRSKEIAMLREALLGAQRYAEKMADEDESKRPDRDLRKEALARVLSGEAAALVTAHRAHDILTALRLADEFGLRLVLVRAKEAWQVADRLAARGVPVVLDPLDNIPSYDSPSPRLDNAARLSAAGVEVVFASFESHDARTIRQAAGNAVANGMGWEAALRALTAAPAALLGLDDRGTLAPGQTADLVVWSGDPFEFSTAAERVFIGGTEASLRSRQRVLMERYRAGN